MVRKTRRSKQKKHSGINTIPELRRAFEYIEEFVDNKISKHESKEHICKDLRKEWRNIFMRELTKASADAFILERMNHRPHRTIRRKGGAMLAGAPIDSVTRPGLYLAPGQAPDANGHMPLSNQAPSAYGSYSQYVNDGFTVPQMGISYDPIKGQSTFPVPGENMGSNVVKGGRRTRKAKKHMKGGNILDTAGSLLSQAFIRPIPSGSPPPILQDMQDMWHGKQVGVSPDQVQRSPSYLIGSIYPKPVHV